MPGPQAQETAPATTQQTAPRRNQNESVWDLVVADMKERDQFGRRKYGGPVQAHSGRDPLVDAYQESLDMVVYLRQAIAERAGQPCPRPARTWPGFLCGSLILAASFVLGTLGGALGGTLAGLLFGL